MQYDRYTTAARGRTSQGKSAAQSAGGTLAGPKDACLNPGDQELREGISVGRRRVRRLMILAHRSAAAHKQVTTAAVFSAIVVYPYLLRGKTRLRRKRGCP